MMPVRRPSSEPEAPEGACCVSVIQAGRLSTPRPSPIWRRWRRREHDRRRGRGRDAADARDAGRDGLGREDPS